MDDLVHAPEEGDGTEILAPAELVRHPLARLPRVVQIEGRGDGVDPKPVGVIAVEPEERAVEQEVRDLAATIVEYERAPVGMLALARVGVLIEVRAVEVGKSVRITREVRWHPVENDPHAAPVEIVHEGHEIPRATEATRGREIADGLIAPRAVKRMLHDG